MFGKNETRGFLESLGASLYRAYQPKSFKSTIILLKYYYEFRLFCYQSKYTMTRENPGLLR